MKKILLGLIALLVVTSVIAAPPYQTLVRATNSMAIIPRRGYKADNLPQWASGVNYQVGKHIGYSNKVYFLQSIALPGQTGDDTNFFEYPSGAHPPVHFEGVGRETHHYWYRVPNAPRKAVIITLLTDTPVYITEDSYKAVISNGVVLPEKNSFFVYTGQGGLSAICETWVDQPVYLSVQELEK